MKDIISLDFCVHVCLYGFIVNKSHVAVCKIKKILFLKKEVENMTSIV